MIKYRDNGSSLVWDMSAIMPGWLLLLLIDPWSATVFGIPAGALLIAMRRIWWGDRPIGGRTAIMLLELFVLPFIAAAAAFRSFGAIPGMALGAAFVALAEWLNRRSGRSFIRRFPIFAAAAFLFLSGAFNAILLERQVFRYPTEDFVKAITVSPDPPRWTEAAKKQAMTAVRFAINRDAKTKNDVSFLYRELSSQMQELVSSPAGRGVFVTLYERSGFRERGFCKGGSDALEDLICAAMKVIKKPPRRPRSKELRPRMWNDSMIGTRIQVDVAGPSTNTTDRLVFKLFAELFRKADQSLAKADPLGDLLSLSYDVEPGVDGMEIASKDSKKTAIMLPAEPVTEGWLTPRVKAMPVAIMNMIDRAWRQEVGKKLALEKGRFKVRKFRTTSFGQGEQGTEIVDLYRGNVLISQDLTRDLLVDRTVQAADWLSRQVGDDGMFRYEIMPPYRGETEDYNLPRHAGGAYGLLAFNNAATKEPKFAEAGKRALDAGLKALDYVGMNLGSPDPKRARNMLCFLGEEEDATSGAAALAALAVVEMPDAKKVDDPELKERLEAIPTDVWLRGLGKCMLRMIDSQGKVFRKYDEALKSKTVKAEPLYYPGEVMLALIRMYNRLGDKKLLEGAKRIADQRVREYGLYLKLDFPKNGDHWIIQALSELARSTGEKIYAELAVLMGRGYLREQYPPQEYLYPDYRGAYRRIADVPRTTRAASRGEALGAAMDAAVFLKEDTGAFKKALIEGARHLIEQQFTETNSYYIPAGFDVQGAIRMGNVDNHCRIDNNQHALVALLRAKEALDGRSEN